MLNAQNIPFLYKKKSIKSMRWCQTWLFLLSISTRDYCIHKKKTYYVMMTVKVLLYARETLNYSKKCYHKHLLIFFNPFDCRIGHVWELFISYFMTGAKSFNIWVTSSSYSLKLIIFGAKFLLTKYYFIILGSIWKHCNTHIKGNWFPRQIWKFCQRSLCHWSWICSKVKVSMTKWFYVCD